MKELFVLSLGGMRYGVWKDSVLSVEDIQTLHRLPLSPACIAGMTILDGRTATLADLSVCLGLPKITREKTGHFLLMSREEKVAGFVVEGEIGHLAIAPDAVRPIPDYLKTVVIDTCAVHGSEPIPVINISLLYSRVQKAESEPPVAEFRVAATEPRDITSIKKVRIFESGEELFAAPAAGIEE
jgi:chemotaxis signal transduction protein